MPAQKNIVELRQLLAGKFPGLRLSAGRPEHTAGRWTTGVAPVDELLGGGLAKGSITELVTPGVACGSALLTTALLRHAAENGQWAALVDGTDSFDPAALDNHALSRLVWVRCTSAQEALKCTDLLLRDGNIPLVVLDLVGCAPAQLRRIPSSTWHRLNRIIETGSLTFLVMTPAPMAGSHGARIVLDKPFSIDALNEPLDFLLAHLSPRLADIALAAQHERKIA